jgi:hypothetical protein
VALRFIALSTYLGFEVLLCPLPGMFLIRSKIVSTQFAETKKINRYAYFWTKLFTIQNTVMTSAITVLSSATVSVIGLQQNVLHVVGMGHDR